MPTSVRLTPEIEERLNFLAAQTGRSKAFYLREIIERGLDEMEDCFLAADVLERVRKGKEKIYPPQK
ncbi:type II toxin-antitoxin system RelB family antitoxin [Nitrosospira multiformis]|uniref:type II toxin-antitoxin system RelB family antitoxin n=1 Tax=Nitrosospira multiformis TaxID=1231 RepID=UPI00089964C6|nr:CopG family transcriptional regulator [Nitrosospira multiformis]SEA71460.1 RHH-type transcriptional regulator, rel operon repressor / antitoxin RelB [Nitrosospira multiformis]